MLKINKQINYARLIVVSFVVIDISSTSRKAPLWTNSFPDKNKVLYLVEVQSRTQGSRPRTQKNPRPRTDFRKQTLSRPRTGMLETKARYQTHNRQVFFIIKKGFAQINRKFSRKFRRSQKKGFLKLTRGLWHFSKAKNKNGYDLGPSLTNQKIVLSSSRGKGIFENLQAWRSKPKTWPSRPRPRTANYVLMDFTFGIWFNFRANLLKPRNYCKSFLKVSTFNTEFNRAVGNWLTEISACKKSGWVKKELSAKCTLQNKDAH